MFLKGISNTSILCCCCLLKLRAVPSFYGKEWRDRALENAQSSRGLLRPTSTV